MHRTYDMETGLPVNKKLQDPLMEAFDRMSPKNKPSTEVNEKLDNIINKARRKVSKQLRKKSGTYRRGR